MAAAAILDNFKWPSTQQLTIYLYSAHRAVIFAIAQLSCIYISDSEKKPQNSPTLQCFLHVTNIKHKERAENEKYSFHLILSV